MHHCSGHKNTGLHFSTFVFRRQPYLIKREWWDGSFASARPQCQMPHHLLPTGFLFIFPSVLLRLSILQFPSSLDTTLFLKRDNYRMAHGRSLLAREQKDYSFEQREHSHHCCFISKKYHCWYILGEVQIWKLNSILTMPRSLQPKNRTW